MHNPWDAASERVLRVWRNVVYATRQSSLWHTRTKSSARAASRQEGEREKGCAVDVVGSSHGIYNSVSERDRARVCVRTAHATEGCHSSPRRESSGIASFTTARRSTVAVDLVLFTKAESRRPAHEREGMLLR